MAFCTAAVSGASFPEKIFYEHEWLVRAFTRVHFGAPAVTLRKAARVLGEIASRTNYNSAIDHNVYPGGVGSPGAITKVVAKTQMADVSDKVGVIGDNHLFQLPCQPFLCHQALGDAISSCSCNRWRLQESLGVQQDIH